MDRDIKSRLYDSVRVRITLGLIALHYVFILPNLLIVYLILNFFTFVKAVELSHLAIREIINIMNYFLSTEFQVSNKLRAVTAYEIERFTDSIGLFSILLIYLGSQILIFFTGSNINIRARRIRIQSLTLIFGIVWGLCSLKIMLWLFYFTWSRIMKSYLLVCALHILWGITINYRGVYSLATLRRDCHTILTVEWAATVWQITMHFLS